MATATKKHPVILNMAISKDLQTDLSNMAAKKNVPVAELVRTLLSESLSEESASTGVTGREGTYRTLKTSFNAYNRYIAKIPLNKLLPYDINKAKESMLKAGIAPRTVRKYTVNLKTALKNAVDEGLIPRSPGNGVKLPGFRKREIQVWTQDQARRFIFLPLNVRKRYHALFVFALATGARLGEILALRWSDIDLEKGIIYIKRTVSGKGYNEPKTASGSRQILIDKDTIIVLKEHCGQQLQEKLRSGNPNYNMDNLIFVTKDGKSPALPTIDRSFASACASAGFPKIRVHDLRHTHATILLLRGVDPNIVKDRLGHSSIKITYDIYAHYMPEHQKQAADVIADVFGSGKEDCQEAIQDNPLANG